MESLHVFWAVFTLSILTLLSTIRLSLKGILRLPNSILEKLGFIEHAEYETTEAIQNIKAITRFVILR